MFFILLFLVFFIALLIIPIPLKIRFNYKNKDVNFYFYNINIDKRITIFRKKTQHRIDVREDQVPIILNTLKIAANILQKIKLKPKLKISIMVNYGLEDAAYTAFAYGIISMICPIIFQLLSSIFNLKDPHFCIQPEYNKNNLRLEIDSIIFVNLVKVIYILILIYRNLRKNRKMNLANT